MSTLPSCRKKHETLSLKTGFPRVCMKPAERSPLEVVQKMNLPLRLWIALQRRCSPFPLTHEECGAPVSLISQHYLKLGKTEVQKLRYLLSCPSVNKLSPVAIILWEAKQWSSNTCSFDKKVAAFCVFRNFPRPQAHLECFLAVFIGQKWMSVKQVAAGNPCSRQSKAVTAAEHWLSQTALEMCCNLKLQHPSREIWGFCCDLCLSGPNCPAYCRVWITKPFLRQPDWILES